MFRHQKLLWGSFFNNYFKWFLHSNKKIVDSIGFHVFYLITANWIIKGSCTAGTNGDYFWEIAIILDFWFSLIYHKVINLTKSILNGFGAWRTSLHSRNEVPHHPLFSCLVVWGIVTARLLSPLKNQCFWNPLCSWCQKRFTFTSKYKASYEIINTRLCSHEAHTFSTAK